MIKNFPRVMDKDNNYMPHERVKLYFVKRTNSMDISHIIRYFNYIKHYYFHIILSTLISFFFVKEIVIY